MYVVLFANYGILLGVVGGICMDGAFPLFFYKHNTTATEYQTNVTIAFSLWACMALVGAVSDTFPIFGHHKRYYLIGASVVQVLSLIGVAESTTANAARLFLLLAATAVMVTNTLWEGLLANMVSFMRVDARVFPTVWGMYMVGLGMGAVVVGTLGNGRDGSNIQTAFLVAAMLSLIPLILLLAFPNDVLPGDSVHSLMTEERLLENAAAGRYKPTPAEWTLAAFLSGGSLLLTFVLLVGAHDAAAVSFGFCVVIVGIAVKLLWRTYKDNRLFCSLCTMSLIQHTGWILITGALDSFYTAGPECFAGGPNFDLVFYYSIVQLISCVVGVLAAIFSAGISSRADTRTVLVGAVTFRIVTGLFDLIIVQRWNIRCVGKLHKHVAMARARLAPACKNFALEFPFGPCHEFWLRLEPFSVQRDCLAVAPCLVSHAKFVGVDAFRETPVMMHGPSNVHIVGFATFDVDD